MSMQSGCHALCQPKARAPYSCPNRKATDRLPLRVISPHCDTSTAFPAIASNDKFRHPKLSRGNQVELVCHDASLLGLEPSYSKFDVAFVSAAQGHCCRRVSFSTAAGYRLELLDGSVGASGSGSRQCLGVENQSGVRETAIVKR
jgi:hypothetical protein